MSSISLNSEVSFTSIVSLENSTRSTKLPRGQWLAHSGNLYKHLNILHIINSAFWKSTYIFLHSIQTCLASFITYKVKWPITNLVTEAFGLKPPYLITFQVQHILCLEYHLYLTFPSRATSQLMLSSLLCHSRDHPALIWKPLVDPSHIRKTEISKLRIWGHQFSG